MSACPTCGTEVEHKFYHPSKFCSRRCSLVAANAARAARRDDRESVLARFNEQYIPEPNSGCWLWTGATVNKGYGSFFYKARQTAHRVAWQLFRGPIPRGRWVLHRCDTPACANPDHLYLGDVKRNVLDAIERGHFSNPPIHKGEAHHFTPLNEENVREIRARYAARRASQRDLAAEYGIQQSAIWAIINRRSWKHVA